MFISDDALSICASGALAQGLGTISGTVTDESGAVVPSAVVVITQAEKNFSSTATTDSAGFYRFPSLAPAPYTLSVTASGFSHYTQAGIVLEA